MQTKYLVMGWLALFSGQLLAAPVKGEINTYPQANGVIEQCIRITPFPGAVYSKKDQKTEAAYCQLDMAKLALCPKLWSTSPGTILYEIDAAAYGNSTAKFESQHCADGSHTRSAAMDEPAIYKNSVNARDTSATYAPASWVYYHLSRYFQTGVHVPVAVYRSMDASSHNQRVVKPALKIVASRHGLGMLTAGWKFMDQAETGQLAGSPASAVLTDDGKQIFGVLLRNEGDRYGAEVNGTRESGWGAGQNNDFQQTAPFLALRDPSPLVEAAEASINAARRNPKMAKDLSADTSVEQIVFWMQDVLEISLLDFILGQQDRIGNIDYNWVWFWLQDGKLRSRRAHGTEAPADIAAFNPLRLKQSAINDNDAGIRAGYADFSEKTHMLSDLRHFNAGLYQRLGALVNDFDAQGPAYQWMIESAGLGSKEAQTIANRSKEAFELLQSDCKSGRLQLDLEPARVLQPNAAPSGSLAAVCEIAAP
jgi:hypothetical protein